MPRRMWLVSVIGAAAVGLLLAACIGPTDLLAPDFLSALGATPQVASLPGDAPALLVAVENRADRLVRATVSYRTGDEGVEVVNYRVEPAGRTAQALICPIKEITMGDVSDTRAIGAEVVLTSGQGQDDIAPFIEVEPFGVLMKEGINYDCGDEVTFAIQLSSATSSGYQIFAYIRRAGATSGP